jgi:hypothetical protein
MQWIIKHFAWFFFKTMGISGAEAVVAAASPFVGQGESACLVRPYVDIMTESEIHLVMTSGKSSLFSNLVRALVETISGFSTIAGSVLSAYINLGVPAQNLITASVMSIPASIAISKIRMPELEEPVTRGRIVVDRGEENAKNAPVNALHAFAKGALFGLVVAGQILCNVLTILSLVATVNGLLTWIGRGFGVHHLTLQLVLRYIFYPITFFLGTYLPFTLLLSPLCPVRRQLTPCISSRCPPLGNLARLRAPRNQTHRERVRGIRKLTGADGLARCLVKAGLYDRIVRAVRVCQPRLARYTDRGVVGAGPVAHPCYCPHRTQRDDRWFYLYVTSCWHCVRVFSIPASSAANICADVVLGPTFFFLVACSSE